MVCSRSQAERPARAKNSTNDRMGVPVRTDTHGEDVVATLGLSSVVDEVTMEISVVLF